MAGMVFEWTSTVDEWDAKKYVVKGGAWDDFPGVTRSAAKHGRPAALKHILIGFRWPGRPLWNNDFHPDGCVVGSVKALRE